MRDDLGRSRLEAPLGWFFEVGVEPVLAELSDIRDQAGEVGLPEGVDIRIDQSGTPEGRVELGLRGVGQYLRPQHVDIAVADFGGLHDIALRAIGEENAFDLKQHLLVGVEGDEVDD